jgi:hypothetical protein
MRRVEKFRAWVPRQARDDAEMGPNRFRYLRRGLAGFLSILCLFLLPFASADSEPPLPIFDCHLHYSEDAWSSFPPNEVISTIRAAGIIGILASSSPDDGTVKLLERAPDLVVPELRPYRNGVSSATWHADADTPAYLRERLAQRRYIGIGEFHLHTVEDARSATVRDAVALAVEHDIHLHVHADAPVIRALLQINPDSLILWAQAGMVTPPDQIRAVMQSYPNVSAELSYPEDQILGEGTLDPHWKSLFLDFPDRFVVGSDTWAPGRWPIYDAIIDDHRAYLKLLPRGLAEKIAFRNAERMFRRK